MGSRPRFIMPQTAIAKRNTSRSKYEKLVYFTLLCLLIPCGFYMNISTGLERTTG